MNSEKRRKLILLVFLGAAAATAFVGAVLYPLIDRIQGLQSTVSTSRAQVAAVKSDLKKLAKDEQQKAREAEVDHWIDEALAHIPRTYIVSAHKALADTLQKRNLEASKIQVAYLLPFRPLPEFAMATWSLSIPKCSPLSLSEAIADLENEFPFGNLAEVSFKTTNLQGTVEASVLFSTAVVP